MKASGRSDRGQRLAFINYDDADDGDGDDGVDEAFSSLILSPLKITAALSL